MTSPSLRSACLVAAVAAMPFLAAAQGTPSAESIINALRLPSGGTRGIRPVSPNPVAEPPAEVRESAPALSAAPAPAGPRPATVPAPPSVNLTVQFGNNSAELTAEAIRTLTELGQALSSPSLANFRFRIEGHTDTVGSPEANRVLSDRRAKTVTAFLSDRFHIDPARLEAAGLGQEGLLVQTRPNTPEPRNRRVQVINLGA